MMLNLIQQDLLPRLIRRLILKVLDNLRVQIATIKQYVALRLLVYFLFLLLPFLMLFICLFLQPLVSSFLFTLLGYLFQKLLNL